MSDALIIRLSHDPSVVQYMLADADGGRLGAVLNGPLSQAAPLAAGRRVIALIPGTDVVAAEPELPARSAARLAQLAPFALEEQLATDIESMHFALGKRGHKGKTAVQAVEKERFEGWLAAIRESGIEPDAVHSESSLIPNNAGITLIVDSGRLYSRRAGSPGITLEVEPLEAALQLALDNRANGDAEEHVLSDLQMYVTQADFDRHQAVVESLNERAPGLQIKLLPEGALPLFALQMSSADPVNFLCGPYERKGSITASFTRWRYAAVLLGIAALLHFGYNGVQLWKSARAEKELDKQINQLVLQSMPGVTLKDSRDARKQFESRLASLKQGGGRGDLLGSLATLGEALAQAPDTKVEAIFYRAQTIDLRVTAPNVDALDKIQQAASAVGLQTTIQSATPRDSKVEGRLQLKSGA